MPEVDQALASHCLEDLGSVTRGCKIMEELRDCRMPTAACEGWSIRDTLFEFLKQSIEELFESLHSKKGRKKSRELLGQVKALSYAIAMMDSPYRPDPAAVTKAARMEVDGSSEDLY